MKNLISHIAFGLLISSVWLSACSTEEIETYSGVQSGIFIQEVARTDIAGNPIAYQDSASYSFSNYGADVTSRLVRVTIRTIGPTVNYDRPYKVEIVPEETTGIEGEDFDISENESVIKAGEATDYYKIRMLRTPKLSQGVRVKVKIRIVPNEYFTLPIQELKNSSSWSEDGEFLPTTTYIITFSEEYSLPFPFDIYWPDYFGSFTAAKMKVVNQVMGYTYQSWSDGTVAYGKLAFMAGETKKYLQQQADAGTPVIDEDGSYMQLGTSYQVDYSDYITENE